MRNENYVSPWTGEGTYLDRVVFRFFDGAKDAMIAAFLAGEIDLATDLLQGDYAAIAGVDPSIGVATIKPAWEHEHFDMNQLAGGPGQGHPALTGPERAHGPWPTPSTRPSSTRRSTPAPRCRSRRPAPPCRLASSGAPRRA